MTLPTVVGINGFKTLIDLSPGIRLPQYEEEIFSDVELAEYYFHKLCEQYGWYHTDDTLSFMVCYYAVVVLRARWPEAESLITIDRYKYWYNGRFGTSI